MGKRSFTAELLAANMKRLRTLNKMSQMELAGLANISLTFVNAIENKQRWVSANTIDKIASALNAKPHELFLPLNNSDVDLHLLKSHHHLISELRDLVDSYEIKDKK